MLKFDINILWTLINLIIFFVLMKLFLFKIKQEAKKASELESQKARLAVKQEIAELAMQAATKVVEKEVSPETNKMLYDQFLNESSDK